MGVEVQYDAKTGAEVGVEAGTGIVQRIEELGQPDKDGSHKGEHRNFRIVIKATHAPLAKPIQSLTQRGEPTLEAARKAVESGESVDYVIQVRRRKGVDRTIPLGNRDTPGTLKADNPTETLNRILVMLDGAVSGEALELSEVPVAVGGPKVGGADADALLIMVSELLKSVKTGNTETVNALSASVTALGATDKVVHDLVGAAKALKPRRETTNPRPTARAAEGKQWDDENSDGSLNVGSYQSQAGIGYAQLAYELVQGRDNAETLLPRLGNALMWTAGQVQTRLTGKPVRPMDPSHTRARGLVRTMIEIHPLPVGEISSEALKTYCEALIKDALMLGKAGLTMSYGAERTAEHFAAFEPAADDKTDDKTGDKAEPAEAPAQTENVKTDAGAVGSIIGAAEAIAAAEVPAQTDEDVDIALMLLAEAGATPLPKYGEPDFEGPTEEQSTQMRELFKSTGLESAQAPKWIAARFGVNKLAEVNGKVLANVLAMVTDGVTFKWLIEKDLLIRAA